MSIKRPTKRVHPSAANKLLRLLEEMEDPTFNFFEPSETGWPIYHPIFHRLWKLLYESSLYLDPYGRLPDDQNWTGEVAAWYPVEYFESASLDQVRRYLLHCTRGERFCDGHMAAQWDLGCLLASLRRFRELWMHRKRANRLRPVRERAR